MVFDGVRWLWHRLRPAEGWLSLFLLSTAIGTVIYAVLDVGWVPEDNVVISTAVLGYLLGVLLAKRPLNSFAAWLLISLYGLTVTTLDLARLWPWQTLTLNQQSGIAQAWRQNSALFYDRIVSWFKAVFTGGSSQETIVFAFALGLLAFFLSAYAGWSAFRQKKPLLGLTLLGAAIAVNGYYGDAEIYWVGFFIGLSAIITAALHYANLVQTWESNQIDYSDEVRWDLLLYAGIISAILLTTAMVLPGVQYRNIAQWFQSTTAVQSVEASLERALGGVRQPNRGTAASPGGVGGSGILPRSYLIGNPPELAERVMMTAVVNVVDDAGSEQIAPAVLTRGTHWRGLSYDVYTGHGWALSEERLEETPATMPIPLSAINAQLTLSQSVNWVWDNRVIRYTLGLPLSFNTDVSVFWRGLEDLSRVQGIESIYQVRTRLPVVTPAILRKTAVSHIPPAILARYTTLPPTVPDRVHELAQEIVGQLDNPYDHARAIEQFLRQYPYSLDIDLPPGEGDPVDYFLFDLQTGYCDYYASSMVVMARSVGLPARIAVGFLSQEPDENGQQTIFQINAHSWAEIYFAGYGWVEFEPTAAFDSPHDLIQETAVSTDLDAIDEPAYSDKVPPPIPEAAPAPTIPWGRIAFILLLVSAGWVWRQQLSAYKEEKSVVWAYGRLQHYARNMGNPTLPQQTPHEFRQALQQMLVQFGKRKWVHHLVVQTVNPIHILTQLFAERQYSQRKEGLKEVTASTWQQLKRPLWLLRVAKWILRLPQNEQSP